MSTDQTASNKALFHRFHDACNSGDIDLISKTIDEALDPDVRIGMELPVAATGVQAFKEIWAMLLRAYPDIHITVEDVIAEGDKLVARQKITGTNQGEYMGRPPTGKTVTYNEIFILRFGGGRVVEIFGVVDVLAQMKQLGMIPA